MTLQVFISYKSEYRDFARAVKSELNQWGFDTWLDVDNIQPGDYFRHKIQAGLDSSDVLLMVLTEEAQLSREVMSEVDYFLDVAKKPVVPLRHRECKPLYIFVSIQYIDFVTDQANGFVQLKQRLNELAQSTVETLADLPAEDEARGGEAPNTEEAILDDFLREKSEQKKEVLEDGLFGPPTLSEIEAPKPQPAPPPPIIQPPSSPITSSPATPILQPQRQAEYIPQPAALGRKRSSPIWWSLAAAASLIVVVGAVVLFSSSANISLTTQLPQETSPLVWVGVVIVLGMIGVFGWRWFGRPKSREGLKPSPTEIDTNRATMLQNVEDFWLKGVLDPALEAGTFEMGLSAAPGAVLRHKDYGDYELPANANILDVFNDLNRELLILGAPGGGKTVLMLQLTKELIKQARGDASKSIPVVFNLSSWAAERKPLGNWLVDELRQKYQVPKKQATAWVEGEKLLLLLDGLDEVAETYRNDCVEAINAYRQQYRTVDLAVCSRVADYDALTSKLDVRGAIVLEPLSQPIIEKYLDRPELTSLRQMMATDEELQEMSQVPFLLNAMAYAYTGTTPTNLEFTTRNDTAKVRRTHLFDKWVEKRLATRSSTEYTLSKVRKWLKWLAEKMSIFDKIVFYIEELQPKWSKLNQAYYQLGTGIILGTIVTLVVMLSYLIGFEVPLEFRSGILNSFFTALILGIICGSAAGSISVVVISLGKRNSNISLAETLTWSFKRLNIGLGVLFGLMFGILLFAAGGTAGVLAIGLVGGIAIGVASGIKTKESIQIRLYPGQGINHNLMNTFRVAQRFGLAIGAGFWLVAGSGIILGSTSAAAIQTGLAFVLGLGLAISLSVGLLFGIFFGGGFSILKHVTLRLILWRSDDIPWNYAQFLDYCASVGIMRKVGGGYIFAHRYLLEYFAELETNIGKDD